jgi:hypothetical protein
MAIVWDKLVTHERVLMAQMTPEKGHLAIPIAAHTAALVPILEKVQGLLEKEEG